MDVRAAAAEALGNLGDELIAVPLLLMIKNHDYISQPEESKGIGVQRAGQVNLGQLRHDC
ncbi:MAG: hypothetical protein AB2L14_01360 [Candidatus Xenobiia bacterium LiM19]